MPNAAHYTAAQFRARAVGLVGLPYVLGAEWPASITPPKRPKALDCSELVEGLFRENNTPIGDLAAAQYDKTVKATGSPRVGDLVFLRNNPARHNGIGHVAVLTSKLSNGDWEIVEARGRAAGVVRTTLSYWKTRRYYTGLRRFPRFAIAKAQSGGEVLFRLGAANMQGGTGRRDWTDQAERLRTGLRCSILCLTETTEASRDAFRRVLGKSWKTWPIRGVAVLWDSRKWTYGQHRSTTFGKTAWHGAIAVPLTAPTGHTVDVIAAHVRPGSIATDAQKQADIAAALNLARAGRPTVLAGDFNTRAVGQLGVAAGFTVAAGGVATHDTGHLDWVLTRGVGVRGRTLHNPGSLSDHRWWIANLTLPGGTS